MNLSTEINTTRRDSGISVNEMTKSNKQTTPLPEQFQPGPMDVIYGRGHKALKHSGNKRFRALLESKLEEYSKATSKLEKSLLVSSILDAVQQQNGSFIKEENRQWYQVKEHSVREKISQE